jgi:hypothetical protein
MKGEASATLALVIRPLRCGRPRLWGTPLTARESRIVISIRLCAVANQSLDARTAMRRTEADRDLTTGNAADTPL